MNLKRQSNNSVNRALIVKLGQIGDVIMAVPAVHELHKKGFDIYWVAGKAVQPLLECYSWINVIPADEKAILFGRPFQRIKSILEFWQTIAFKKFDICTLLYYDKRYRLLTLPVRAKSKLMLSLRSRSTTLLPGRHHVDEYARVLLQWADTCREQSLLPVRPDHLPRSPLPEKTVARRIAIVPGGVKHLVREQALGQLPAQALRRWPIESFVALAKQLSDRGWEVVLLGGPEDTWVRPYFQHIPVSDCIGTLSLPEVVSVCDTCEAVITHDTGPLHLAGLSETCLVGIFGPTDPATRIPRRPFAVGIWGGQGFACRPCYDGRDFAPCRFNGCMHQVSPDLVLRELDRLLHARSVGKSIPWHIVFPDLDLPIEIPLVEISPDERAR